jgi:hypothetical protein
MSIKFPCPRCKNSLRVPDELAGKKAKCPHCSSAVGVPAAGAARAAVKAAPAKSAHNPKVEFAGLSRQVQSPTGAGKPYKRQRGNPVMKLMYLTLALFLLGGGAYAAVRFNLMVKMGLKSAPSTEVAEGTADSKPKDGPAATGKTTQAAGATAPVKETLPPLVESHFFPDGTVGIGSVNFESVLNSKAYSKFKESQSPDKLFDALLKPILGLQLAATSRLQVAFAPPDDRIVVIRPRNPVTIDEIKLSRPGTYKEAKIGRFTMYESTSDAYCLAEDQMLVVGTPASLKKVLERNKPPELKPELDAAYRLMNPAKTVGLALQTQAGDLVKGVAPGPIPKELEAAAALVLQLDLAQGLDIAVTLQFKDAEATAAAKKAVETLMATGKTTLEPLQKDDNEKIAMAAKKGEELLGQVKITAEGASLTASLTLNDEVLTQLIGLLPEKLGQ